MIKTMTDEQKLKVLEDLVNRLITELGLDHLEIFALIPPDEKVAIRCRSKVAIRLTSKATNRFLPDIRVDPDINDLEEQLRGRLRDPAYQRP